MSTHRSRLFTLSRPERSTNRLEATLHPSRGRTSQKLVRGRVGRGRACRPKKGPRRECRAGRIDTGMKSSATSGAGGAQQQRDSVGSRLFRARIRHGQYNDHQTMRPSAYCSPSIKLSRVRHYGASASDSVAVLEPFDHRRVITGYFNYPPVYIELRLETRYRRRLPQLQQ